MIAGLCQLDLGKRRSYGTKASALGELIKSGQEVPVGFALSSEFFTKYLQYNKIYFASEDYLDYNREIYKAILDGEFSEEMNEDILKFFRDLEGKCEGAKYAVRSSALCEDNEFYSMAGMFSSFINLTSFEEIKASIKACYGSLFQDKVIAYFIRNKLDFKDLKMGVIIQKFIEGQHSGVNFSVDTMDMNDEVMHINVVNGICDDYVSGKKLSAFYKIDKKTGEILEEKLPDDFNRLPEKSLKRLYANTLTVERIFGKPQDIEWTIKENKIYVLQSRPITTFKVKGFKPMWVNEEDENYTWYREADKPYEPLINELNLILGEALNDGFYKTGFQDFYSEYCVQNGYFFYRDKEMLNAVEQKQKFLKFIDDLHKENKNIFQDIVLPELLDFKVNSEDPIEFLDKAIEYMKFLASKHQVVIHGCDYLDGFMEYCKGRDDEFNIDSFYDLVFNVSILNKEREFYIYMAHEVNQNKILYRMFQECSYDEILYRRLKKVDESKELFKLIESYLVKFGICILESEVNSPYFDHLIMEEPSKIIGNIRSLLHSNVEEFKSSIENSLENKAKVKARILKKVGEDGEKDFLDKFELAEKAYLSRDNHHYYFERMTKSYVRLALEEGKKVLIENGSIEESDDLYFLSLDEIKEGLMEGRDFQKVINERKEIFNYEKKVFVPEIIGKETCENNNSLNEATEEDERDLGEKTIALKGISGLRKIVKGKVKVGIPTNLDEESILVLPFTRCGDITPIIRAVKGIIVESGSPFEHLGIFAREMNIPVLYNVKNAMSILKEGDLVKLDGVVGEVEVIES